MYFKSLKFKMNFVYLLKVITNTLLKLLMIFGVLNALKLHFFQTNTRMWILFSWMALYLKLVSIIKGHSLLIIVITVGPIVY